LSDFDQADSDDSLQCLDIHVLQSSFRVTYCFMRSVIWDLGGGWDPVLGRPWGTVHFVLRQL